MSFLNYSVFARCCEERATSGTIALFRCSSCKPSLSIMSLQVLHRSVIHLIFFMRQSRVPICGQAKENLQRVELRKAEANTGRSVTEWNPVSTVALALQKDMCITCALSCVPCFVADDQTTNVVKWSGTKDEMKVGERSLAKSKCGEVRMALAVGSRR